MTTGDHKQKSYDAILATLQAIPAKDIMDSRTVCNTLKMHLLYAVGKRIASYTDIPAVLQNEKPGTTLWDVAVREEQLSGTSFLSSKDFDETQKQALLTSITQKLSQAETFAHTRKAFAPASAGVPADTAAAPNPQDAVLSILKAAILDSTALTGIQTRIAFSQMTPDAWRNTLKESTSEDWRDHIAAIAFDPIERAIEAGDVARLRELYKGLEGRASGLTIWGQLEKAGCEAALKELGQPLSRSGKKAEL